MEHLVTKKSVDYELLDSGEGMKLERYGAVVLSRPDPQVLWAKALPESEWQKAHVVFEHEGARGKWHVKKDMSTGWQENWRVALANVTCVLKLSPFKHIGLFPEQSAHWAWLQGKIKTESDRRSKTGDGAKVSVLNLFGYTGGASVACALAGADVTHVDASESAVKWGKQNRDASGLSMDAIRFLVDDARKFVEREVRRGKIYDIIILDPPVYGRGSKNELWKIENDLVPFLSKIKKILSPQPLAVLLNGYAAGYSHIAYEQALAACVAGCSGTLSSGELTIEESSMSARLLPCGIFAKWEK